MKTHCMLRRAGKIVKQLVYHKGFIKVNDAVCFSIAEKRALITHLIQFIKQNSFDLQANK